MHAVQMHDYQTIVKHYATDGTCANCGRLYIIAEPDFAPIFDILQNVFAAFVQYFQRWRMTSWRLSMRVTVNLRERCGSLAGCRPKHAYLPPAPLGPISLLRNHRQQP